MRFIVSFVALLLSVVFLQLSTGTLNPFDALSGVQSGFSKTQIGLLGTMHFLGFFVGCWWAPRLIGTIGHARSFAVFAALGALSLIAHPLWIFAPFWAMLRILSGMCIAGGYTVIEAWFSAKLTNNIRGRMMSIYRIVDISASSLGQLMIGFLAPAAYFSYNLLAIIACACLLPLLLTRVHQPAVLTPPRLRPLQTFLSSPLGVASVIVSGVTSASLRTVVPVYGVEIGLSSIQIGYFLFMALLGGALAQFPVGWLADKFDRRYLLIALSLASFFVCSGIIWVSAEEILRLYLFSFLFGAVTIPIFSVAAAHANDFVDPDEYVALNASLMLFFSIGAIFSPLIASGLMQYFGPSSLFTFISLAHISLIIFGLIRMRVRPTRMVRTAYLYIPRTSVFIGRLLGRNDD